MKADGVFTERIDYNTRYFVPMEGAEATRVLKQLTQYRPVAEITEAGAQQDMAAGDEGMFSIRGTAAKDGREGFITAETDKLAQAVARRIFPELRIELDKLGLEDVDLDLPGKLTARTGGKTYLRQRALSEKGHRWSRSTPTISSVTMHHEVLHALRDLGLFKDSEWGILSTKARQAWRKQYPIDRLYGHLDDEGKDEEGVAHAYAAWDNDEIKVDGRIARLFKRIKAFFEALRNALHGLGFKTAEDVFRRYPPGEIGGRDRAGVGGESPMFARSYENAPDNLMGFRRYGQQKSFDETNYRHTQPVRVTFDDGETFTDEIKGLNKAHAIERAHRNWPDAKIEPIDASEADRPMFSVRDEAAPAALKDDLKLTARIRERIEAALDSKFAHKFIEGTQDLSHRLKFLQRDFE